MKLSYSKIKTYLECPYKYRLCYIERIPQKPKSYFKFASKIHHILHKYHLYQKNFNLRDLLTCFERTWGPKKGNLYEEGRRILINYYEKMKDKIPYSSEERFTVRIGKNILIGKIDRIDKIGNQFSILDYKLNKNILTPKEVKDSLQLNLYSLAFYYLTGIIPLKAGFYFLRYGKMLFTEKNIEDLNKTKTLISYVANQIIRREFCPKESEVCKWCDYKEYCFSIEGKSTREVKTKKLTQLILSL